MPELYPEDQERVNKVLSQGVNSVERKPIRFWTLLIVLIFVLGFISLASYLVASYFEFL